MISTLTDAAKLNEAANSLVADLLRGFSAEEWLSDPDHVALTDGENIGLFEKQDGNVWAGHTLFRDRGKKALEVGRDMLKIMFLTYGAAVIRGETPVRKIGARWFNRKLGFKSRGFYDCPFGAVELFIMEKMP